MKDRPGLSDLLQPDCMNDHLPLDLLPSSDDRRPETIKLTFLNNKEDIRWLSAGSSARHRQSIFTGSGPLPLHDMI